MLDVASMHIALLHLLASQTTPPGTLTIGEGVALAVLTAIVGIAAAWGMMRGQVNDLSQRAIALDKRVDALEVAAPTTTLGLARLEVRLDAMDKSIGEGFAALRRELHASGHLPRHRDGE